MSQSVSGASAAARASAERHAALSPSRSQLEETSSTTNGRGGLAGADGAPAKSASTSVNESARSAKGGSVRRRPASRPRYDQSASTVPASAAMIQTSIWGNYLARAAAVTAAAREVSPSAGE